LRRLSWIITLPITVLAVVFALSNSEDIEVDLWPLPWGPAVLPVYLLILGCLLLGFLLGTVVAWMSGAGRRRRVRKLSEQVRAQADEISALRQAALASSSAIGNDAVRNPGLPAAARSAQA
jgi:uncharacterized integral membrane protein